VNPAAKPTVLLDPQPRRVAEIFSPADLAALAALTDLREVPAGADRDAFIEELLPEVTVIIGQTALDERRLAKAANLQAVFNVEGNFLPNIDYDTCFRRGIHVASVGPVFAQAVAELGLGLALDLARGITRSHTLFQQGTELYGLEGNQEAFLLSGRPMGIIGYGALGRALAPLLAPFGGRRLIHDPWLPDREIARLGFEPVSLEKLLSESQVVFVTAGATTENGGFLDAASFTLMPRGSLFVLLSRASVVNFDDMNAAALSGHIKVATDVFPEEPLAGDSSARKNGNMILSAHRAGAVESVFKEMGAMVLSDIRQVIKGLPPVSCVLAVRETVAKTRSKPVAKS
jgi:phosphoglycerate dehydrogenase-like enzyme